MKVKRLYRKAQSYTVYEVAGGYKFKFPIKVKTICQMQVVPKYTPAGGPVPMTEDLVTGNGSQWRIHELGDGTKIPILIRRGEFDHIEFPPGVTYKDVDWSKPGGAK